MFLICLIVKRVVVAVGLTQWMDGVESAAATASADLATSADLTVRGLLSADLALELLSICVLPNRVQVAAQLPTWHFHNESRANWEVMTLFYFGHGVSRKILRWWDQNNKKNMIKTLIMFIKYNSLIRDIRDLVIYFISSYLYLRQVLNRLMYLQNLHEIRRFSKIVLVSIVLPILIIRST